MPRLPSRRTALRVLSLTAYDAASHTSLRNTLEAGLARHDWSSVRLPGRHFAWRFQGNAHAFASAVEPANFDVLLAFGPVDLSTLLGLRPDLAALPNLLYLHENEFAYPHNPREQGRLERQVRTLFSLLAADRVLVNSQFHIDSLRDGVGELARRMPDGLPDDPFARIEEKLAVIPVPVNADAFAIGVTRAARRQSTHGGPVRLVWNHRLEWDKGVDRLEPLVSILRQRKLPFVLDVLGATDTRSRSHADPLGTLLPEGHPQRGHFGRIDDRADYLRVLGEADLVLSTALHEFQGLAVLEGTAAGCIPCVPDRLAYPDFLPRAFRYAGSTDDAHADAQALVERLIHLWRDPPAMPSLDALRVERVLAIWEDELAALVDAGSPHPMRVQRWIGP